MSQIQMLRAENKRLCVKLAAKKDVMNDALRLIHNCTLVIDRERHRLFLHDVEKFIDRHAPKGGE